MLAFRHKNTLCRLIHIPSRKYLFKLYICFTYPDSIIQVSVGHTISCTVGGCYHAHILDREHHSGA
eukprot:2861868-Karenia_brevis.AAC.1